MRRDILSCFSRGFGSSVRHAARVRVHPLPQLPRRTPDSADIFHLRRIGSFPQPSVSPHPISSDERAAIRKTASAASGIDKDCIGVHAGSDGGYDATVGGDEAAARFIRILEIHEVNQGTEAQRTSERLGKQDAEIAHLKTVVQRITQTLQERGEEHDWLLRDHRRVVRTVDAFVPLEQARAVLSQVCEWPDALTARVSSAQVVSVVHRVVNALQSGGQPDEAADRKRAPRRQPLSIIPSVLEALNLDFHQVAQALSRLASRLSQAAVDRRHAAAHTAGGNPAELLDDSLAAALRAPLSERLDELRLHAVVACCVAAYAPETVNHWEEVQAAIAKTKSDIQRAGHVL